MIAVENRFGVVRDAVVRAARVLHPFLFAIAPILYVAAKNAHQIELGQAARPLAYTLAAAGLLVWGLRRLLGDYALAAALASLALIAFFAGGAAHEFLREGAQPLPWGVAVALEWGLLVVAFWLAWRWLRAGAARVRLATTFLTVFALLATLESAADFLRHDRLALLLGAGRPVEAPPPRPAAPPLAAETAATPDIYFIVADAYARRDVLERAYGADAGEFTRWLESRGFYVASQATSNYAMTYLSLAATLNMAYLDPARMPAAAGRAGDRVPYYRMIRAPAVARELQARGYRYVQVLTHWGGTDRSYAADLSYRLVPLDGDEFTVALLNKTLLRAFTPRLADQHRFILDRAAAIADIPGPTFAFVHLLLPHNPYVFDREGGVVADLPLGMDFQRQAGAWSEGGRFVDQLEFTNGALRELIETIQARSTVPPIIILQGDHGTSHTADHAAGLEAQPQPWERMGILSAFHVPPAVRARLYPAISPVNTFRVLLDAQFGAGSAPLPDRSYFSYYDDPYRFEDVTGRLAVPPVWP